MLDDRDRRLLHLLQADAEIPVMDLAREVSLSPSACSRRIARLRDEGFIQRSVAVVDRRLVGLPATVFVLLRTSEHTTEWLERFRKIMADIPEIMEVHRLTGSIDYIMKVVLPDIESYDDVYNRIVSRISLFDVSAYISMETLKSGNVVPTAHA